MWESHRFETFRQDTRYALRRLWRSPGFTAVAISTLALGIGATTAIFSLTYALLLHTLPVRHPGELVELLHRYPGEPHLNGFSWQTYQLMRDNNHVFSGLIAAIYQPFQMRGQGLESQTIQGGYVDGTFFSVLGLQPAIGRLIGQENDRVGNASAVAVLSWSYWKNRFNCDRAIVGRQIVIDDIPVTIIGVAPRKFAGLQVESAQDVWLPLAADAKFDRSDSTKHILCLIGRLRPGVPLEQARAQMALLYRTAMEEQVRTNPNPFLSRFRFEMEPAGTGLSQLREQYGKPLLAVMSISGMLLLIACTNVASMLLARGAAREAEMGLRVTLGASRSRLFGESVTESMILSIASGIMGVALAYFGTGALVRMIVSARHVGAPLDLHVRVDSSVLLFASTLVVVTGFLIGLVPALRALRRAPASSLREMATAGGRRSRNLGKGLVVIQVALSVVLLSAAVLFVGRLSHLEHINLGFRRDHVLLMKLDAENSGYDNEQLSHAYQDLLQRLKDIPGVRSATLSASTPISGAGANRGVTVEGYEAKPGELRNVMENWVAPKYFETLGTPLLLGRDFEFEERGGRVAIINQTMARYYFGNTNPIRRHVTFDRDAQPYEIIGVVGDAKYIDIREPIMRTIYLNTFQHTHVASQLVLRTSNDPVAVVSDVRRAVNGILVGVTVKRVTTLSDQIDESIVPERLVAVLSGWFGSLGLLLAALGLYGLLAYTVTRRINEIGIRMALGATGAEVARTVLHDAFLMVFSGLLIGTPLEFWGRKMALSLVPELPSGSVLLLVSGVVAMMAVALLAAYLPASRAASVDPMEALRYE